MVKTKTIQTELTAEQEDYLLEEAMERYKEEKQKQNETNGCD